ncbi:hypothetical protein [Sediminibacillus massiliensis]|uniref:hypothetical protein n=1 Tax=Sediminibacillus massiliensis TaxID=1926277 RepID=UPI00098856AE|nr:hypothetical protein [Sediminibacillus massiliensis]
MKRIHIVLLVFMTVLLSGCLYPNEQLTKNEVPNEVQLQTIQSAVDQYRENNQGLVPIKTKPNETPVFQKYLIDFTKLKEQNLISEIPGTAFENGGVYQYILITPEEDPRVKVIDLRMTQEINTVERYINQYRDEHLYPPFGEEVADGIYKVNYSKIGLENPPTIPSPYSQDNLSLVMDTNGDIYVDYRAELYKAIKNEEHDYEAGDDIRYLLAETTPFAPAYSLPYTIESGSDEPVFAPDLKTP